MTLITLMLVLLCILSAAQLYILGLIYLDLSSPIMYPTDQELRHASRVMQDEYEKYKLDTQQREEGPTQ